MAESPKLTALKKLSSQLPVANSRIAQQQQAGRDLQLQQAVARAPSSAGTAQAQASGQQQAAAAGQQQLQAQETGMQQQGQVAQLGAQQQQMNQQQQQFGLQQGVEQQKLNNVQKFAQISEQAKREMFDSRMQFQKDEQGRTFLNERQLADYAKLSAQGDQQYQQYAMKAKQAHELQIHTLETMNKRLELAMKDKFAREQEGLDRIAEEELYQMKKQVEDKIAKARADAANKGAMWGAIGTIAGAGIGVLAGGGASGAMAGGQIGGAAGQYGASAT